MTTNPIIRVLAIALLLVTLAGCGGADSAASSDEGGGGAEAGAVTIADLAYSPADIEVGAGGSVTWTNNDDAPHTVTFDDEAVTSSEEMAKGDEFSATFDEAGSYSYVCAIHPDMKGTVTVS